MVNSAKKGKMREARKSDSQFHTFKDETVDFVENDPVHTIFATAMADVKQAEIDQFTVSEHSSDSRNVAIEKGKFSNDFRTRIEQNLDDQEHDHTDENLNNNDDMSINAEENKSEGAESQGNSHSF
jgi:hypothetical protein